MCVSYVSGDLRTRCVGDTTTLPGAFEDWLARPSLPWHVLVVVHSDALVRGGDRCGPGTANHNIVGGTVGVGSVGVVVVGGGAVVVAVVVIVAVIAWWAAAIAVNSATATADTAVAAAATDGATVR